MPDQIKIYALYATSVLGALTTVLIFLNHLLASKKVLLEMEKLRLELERYKSADEKRIISPSIEDIKNYGMAKPTIKWTIASLLFILFLAQGEITVYLAKKYEKLNGLQSDITNSIETKLKSNEKSIEEFKSKNNELKLSLANMIDSISQLNKTIDNIIIDYDKLRNINKSLSKDITSYKLISDSLKNITSLTYANITSAIKNNDSLEYIINNCELSQTKLDQLEHLLLSLQVNGQEIASMYNIPEYNYREQNVSRAEVNAFLAKMLKIIKQ